MWLTLLFQKQKCRKLTCFMSQTSPSLKLKYKVPREEMTLRYMTQREQWVTQMFCLADSVDSHFQYTVCIQSVNSVWE
ncbi:hypothetical protein LOK49_LG03G01023 [Camellia lanceoleosa]|uniref:Uncharacterized protein n=1 Tax=Camellia lanceoleosa TaxID=1840588 RepID=A0ACC0I6D6_9ERIC|nr:hypothetical protein LOK49_LG03G01023 [Camellia lanceoleosa]